MMMRKRLTQLRSASCFTILFLFGLLIAPSVLEAQVSGIVFRDFNGNGVKNNSASFNETFVQGIEVKAYNATGTQVGGTQTTSASGAYSFTGLTLPVRIEFGNFPTGDFSGPLSNQSLSSVQFHAATTTSANLAINYPAHYCQGSPYLVSPCYVNNRPTGTGNEAIVKYPNTASGTTSVNSYLAQAQDVGSTWGLAYNKDQKLLYASAFVKRHVALVDNDGNGKEDIGAIYSMTATGSPALWLDLASLGVDVGLSLMPTVAVRALPTDKTQAAHDPLLFDLVGKIGLGDIDISDDSKLLYVVNLFDKKVYTIDIATKQFVGSGIAVPNACTGGTVRPFGLAYHRNKLYVGAICDGATSQDTADVKANLYRLDGSTFTNILSFPLSYRKGAAEIGYNNQWYAWRSSFYPVVGYINPPEYEYIYPQPIFADIQFDVNEELILVFNDRLGHQTGYENYGTNTADNNLYTGIVGGDILRAALVNGTYVLEKNASVGGVTTAGAGNNQGPGGGEFYFEEKFDPYHEEVVMGGAAIMAGGGLVAVNIYDPFALFSGGTAWMNNQTGTVDRAYQVFKSFAPVTFGKANGLGAVAFLCNAAPLEIGNVVWNDANHNGIYDANESGIDGVVVELYDGATKVGTATTANGGQYAFNTTNVNLNGAMGLKPSTAYTLKIAATQYNNTGIASTPLSKLTLTTTDATSNGLADVSDNDALAISGIATIAYTTGNAGENNHSLDFGFRPPCGDTFRICPNKTLTATAQAGSTNVQWQKNGVDIVGETNLTLLIATVGNYTYTATTATGCSGSLCCPIVVLDSICCVSPTLTSVATDTATCTNGVANSNAKVAVRGIVGMAKYAYRSNATDSLFALNATASTADSIQLAGLANHSVSTTYMFRIWGADTTCYNDTTVTLTPSVCPPCSIVATFTQNPCNGNGTTAITTDDYFAVTVSAVSATNGGTSGKYEVLLNGMVLNTGGTTYGTPVTVGTTTTFKSDGATTYSLTVRDMSISTCVTPAFMTTTSAACSTIACKPVICLPVTVSKF